jgi:tetratricopeptide (TPR) repeat protein
MGELEEANRLCEETLALEGRAPSGIVFDFVEVHTELGILAQRLGRSDEAIRRLRQVAESGAPRADRAWFWMGKVYGAKGQREKERAAYEKVLEKYDETDMCGVSAMIGLGKLEFDAGRYEKAAEWFRRARKEAAPTNPHPVFSLALALERMGQLEEAHRLCLETLRMESRLPPGVVFEFADVYVELGNLAQKLGRPEETVERYREALRRSPGHPQREAIRANIKDLRASQRDP